ncbi:hypothetical protein ABZ383_34580 [Streptomyces sp. NPDC005900]|uniref:hypothetical protein n=1 Tax=Streptomyces sp. NPDC005900 TaxID=3154569 RepID=UPI0033DCA6A0
MSEQHPPDDAEPEPDGDETQTDEPAAPRRQRPTSYMRLQNDLLRLTGRNLPLVTASNTLSQFMRETSPMRRTMAQMRDLGITPTYFHISASERLSETLNEIRRSRSIGLAPVTPLLQVRSAALQLRDLYPALNIRDLAAFAFPIPADLEEELGNDLDELEEPARQFLLSQGPLSWTEQRRLFALFVTAFFFILLLTAVIENEAVKELGEAANLVWAPAAAAGLVAHKHWDKISPRPPGEEDEEDEQEQAR